VFEQFHKLRLLFGPDEQIQRVFLPIGWSGSEFFEQSCLASLLAPAQQTFLMGDAKKPTAKLFVRAQAPQLPGGVDEGLLDDVQAGLLFMNQFEYIDIQR